MQCNASINCCTNPRRATPPRTTLRISTDAYACRCRSTADAFTKCKATGGDADYDGGCARAVSYSAAYAEACAEAIAAAFVDYTYGKQTKCHCDVSVQTIQSAIAHEVEIIYAFYETKVEARSCNWDNIGTPDLAYIAQSCIASSAADLLVKVWALLRDLLRSGLRCVCSAC